MNVKITPESNLNNVNKSLFIDLDEDTIGAERLLQLQEEIARQFDPDSPNDINYYPDYPVENLTGGYDVTWVYDVDYEDSVNDFSQKVREYTFYTKILCENEGDKAAIESAIIIVKD